METVPFFSLYSGRKRLALEIVCSQRKWCSSGIAERCVSLVYLCMVSTGIILHTLDTYIGRYRTVLFPFLAIRSDMGVNVRPDFFLQAPVGVLVVRAVPAVEPEGVSEGEG